VQLAEKLTPNAVDVASGLNIAAFNIGIAVGSILGGAIVDGMTLSDTAWIGALISVTALVVTRYSGHLDKRALAQNQA
jgi:predicted MFS family arabinose efflux permease